MINKDMLLVEMRYWTKYFDTSWLWKPVYVTMPRNLILAQINMSVTVSKTVLQTFIHSLLWNRTERICRERELLSCCDLCSVFIWKPQNSSVLLSVAAFNMHTFSLTNCLWCETDTNLLKVKPQSTFTAGHNTIKTNHKLELHNIVMNVDTQGSTREWQRIWGVKTSFPTDGDRNLWLQTGTVCRL